MAVSSQGELFSALAKGSFETLVGTEEQDWLDFKLTGYRLDEPRQRWELAKDVAALANAHGGCLVMGVRTKRQSHEITDVATEISPVRKELIDPKRYLDVIERSCYPPVGGVKAHWFPPEGPDGLFVLEVPIQPETDRPFLVTRTVTEEGTELNAVMIPRRDGSRVVTMPPGQIHRLLSQGLSPASAIEAGEQATQVPDDALEELERSQGWEELPALFLQAIPSSTARLRGFYEEAGVKGALSRHVPARPHVAGFGLRLHASLEVRNAGFEYLADFRRAIRIEPSGLFSVGALATSDYLAWATGSWVEPGTSQVWLNSIALVETVVEFYRFLEAELVPAAPSGTRWRSRVVTRRFDRGPVCLRGGPPGPGLPMVKPPVASASTWESDVTVSGDAQRDAFRALVEIYALFGLPESDIPYSADGRVDLEALRKA